jgi:hypothetical protein
MQYALSWIAPLSRLLPESCRAWYARPRLRLSLKELASIYQFHGVPAGGESPCPLMRSRAGFHADQARRQLRDELTELRPGQSAPCNHRALRIYRVHGKHIFCQVDSDRRNCVHGTSPFERMDLSTQSWHLGVTSGRGSSLHSLGVMSYSADWRRYQITTRFGIGALAAVPVTGVLSAWAKSYQATRPLAEPFAVAAVVCALLFVVLFVMQAYFRCPRCGKLFSRVSWWTTLRAGRSCVHCGLRLYHDA